MTRTRLWACALISAEGLLIALGCGPNVDFYDPGSGSGGTAQGGSSSSSSQGGVTTGVVGVTSSGVAVGGSTTSSVSTGATTTTATSVTSTGQTSTNVTSTSSTAVGGMGPGPATVTTVSSSGVGGAPSCPHGVCIEGPPLDPNCGMCESTVCTQDPFCCNVFWDGICVQEANQLCNAMCPSCPHDICTTGQPIDAACDPCAAQVCAQDPTCCSQSWDGGCVQMVFSICNISC
jgi:hypothetical protein